MHYHRLEPNNVTNGWTFDHTYVWQNIPTGFKSKALSSFYFTRTSQWVDLNILQTYFHAVELLLRIIILNYIKIDFQLLKCTLFENAISVSYLMKFGRCFAFNYISPFFFISLVSAYLVFNVFFQLFFDVFSLFIPFCKRTVLKFYHFGTCCIE